MSEPWRDAVVAVVAGTKLGVDEAIAHVREALSAGASATHAADLALAWAVARGDAVAAKRFDALVGPEIVAAARAIDRAPAFVDEIAQQTRVRLVVGDGNGPPRVATYRGAGPLRAWAAIAAQRMALNAKRDARQSVGDDVLADVVDREPDPELRHLKMLYRSEFRDALLAALASVPDRSRAVLRLRFVEGLELAQIGRLYGVHESTASRWASSALEAIAVATRENLIARLAISNETADSVVRMVQSQLDLSIGQLLR